MHYTQRGVPITVPRQARCREDVLRERIRNEVLPTIPRDSWQETDEILPLTEPDLGPWGIAAACLRFCDGSLQSDAVYVLECKKNSRYREDAIYELAKAGKRSWESPPSWWERPNQADRIIYVGYTTNLVRRFDEHLNSPGFNRDGGANFTTLFPPVRILSVEWYGDSYVNGESDQYFGDGHDVPRAILAERITAELMEEEFPEDFIYQS